MISKGEDQGIGYQARRKKTQLTANFFVVASGAGRLCS